MPLWREGMGKLQLLRFILLDLHIAFLFIEALNVETRIAESLQKITNFHLWDLLQLIKTIPIS